MVQKIFFRIVWLLILVLVQALVLNNVNLFGCITPYLYVYFILMADVNESKNVTMLWAFFCGILIDMFSNTPGINAASSIFIAFVRLYVLRLFVSRDVIEQGTPSIKSIGLSSFSKYILLSVLLHHLLLVLLCYFSLSSVGEIVLRILLSSLLTFILILVIDNTKK